MGVVGAGADLDWLFEEVEVLRRLAADPVRAQDSGRVYDFRVRWGTVLSGRLPRLAYYYGRGELSSAERERYEVLCMMFRDAQPLIERLGVAPPSGLVVLA